MGVVPFGVGGRPRKSRPTVENTQRVASPPHKGLAREEIKVRVDGVEIKLDIIRHERPRGGSQAFWCCPTCGREVWHLYIRTEGLMCRKCAGLTYWSRQTYRRGLHRVRNLRRKLGAPPGLLAKVPPRPPHWRRDYWARTVAKLAAAEAVIAVELRDMVPRVRRRLRT
jgi:hypothetical protein